MSDASDSTIAALPISEAEPLPKPVPVTKRRRWAIALAGALLVAAAAIAGVLAYRRAHATASTFRTVPVVRADITERVTATGTLQPIVTSPVGAQVSGIVWKLHADYNSKVTAGQLLVELDPALFRNAVAQATAQLAQAKASLASAKATSLGAEVVHDRTLALAKESLVSGADVDASEAVFGQAAGQEVSGTAQIEQARAQLARANLDLQHSIIRSPVDGTVISRNIDVGQAVASTLTAPTLFTIAQDLKHMQVHAAVDEADIGDVLAGQSATFTVDAFRDETFSAVVHEVRNAPQTAQNVVTYDVVLDVDNPEEKLRPGMTANVLILIVHKTQVVAVPNEALRFRPAGGSAVAKAAPSGGVTAAPAAGAKAAATAARSAAGVYVVQGGVAVRVPITAGVTDGSMTEVSGIEPGSEVIVDVSAGKNKAPAAGGSGRGL
jgi:HlyD family secretion protein